jgi:glycerate kinase
METRKRYTICVVDGQGGGIGAVVIKKLKDRFGEDVEIIALGTNAIIQTVKKADVIIGPVGIIMPHAMMGEVTGPMAEAISLSDARKVLLPLSQENIDIVGVAGLPLPMLVDELMASHLSFMESQ